MSFDDKTFEIPSQIPLLPVRDMVIFPYMILPLIVGRDVSIRSVEEALNKNRLIFLASQKDVAEESPTPESIHSIGTVAMIMRMRRLSDGRVKILVQGVAKAKITSFNQVQPYFDVQIQTLPDQVGTHSATEVEALIRTVKEQLERVIALGRSLPPDILLVLDDVQEPGRIADLIASNLGVKVSDAQDILESVDAFERLNKVHKILTAELDILQVQHKTKAPQREQFLREQMKAIKSELGEGDSKSEEIEELRSKIMAAGMPAETEKESLKQLSRLERMHPDASEASMVRTYLDWMVDLPWSKRSDDRIDLSHAKKVLDDDHYDLQKAKDRVLEFLAVKKLKSTLKGPILCLLGPPGVGKTSLGKSIARAMNREYFRVALGGVKDEAEIRGHRRTYVGAMPGKIVQSLRQVKVKNPVFVLDEIDKLGSDFRGDPSAAMLEVLDPEQNHSFRDHYLNVDFDLSEVFFMATANVYEDIPAALRDRMEVIHISGYTDTDKLLITKKHLIDRQIEANGIEKKNISFTDEGLNFLISHYTREAGLRNLEREIGSVCRKVAKFVVLGEKDYMQITPEAVVELLGPPRFLREDRVQESQVGVATGLAWTMAGGDVLSVEALKYKGKGSLVLTGKLGDVMKESAQAALTYVKAHADALGIDTPTFENYDFHIHLPAGAIPKDGPSAGITLTTALVSQMLDIPIRHDLAMTGEVTLQGRVLPVGGIREKCLAALSYGIKDVILPMQNKKDLADIPDEFRSKMNFIFVENVDEVFSVALEAPLRGKKTSTAGTGRPTRRKSNSAAA